MPISSIRREIFEYRGYSLQITYATLQWQVFIDAVLGARPAIAPDKQIVRGWDEGGDPEARKNADRPSD